MQGSTLSHLGCVVVQPWLHTLRHGHLTTSPGYGWSLLQSGSGHLSGRVWEETCSLHRVSPASGTAPPVGPSRVLISHLLQHRPCPQGAPGQVWAGWGDGRGGERSISPGDHGPDRAQRLGTGQKRHQESCDGWAAEVSSSYDRGSDQTEGMAGARLLVRRASACSRTKG